MEVNFRCAALICQAANALIRHNPGRFQKDTVAARTGGAVQWAAYDGPGEEMAAVADQVVRERDKEGVAVLARNNRTVDEYATLLRARGVPVRTRKYAEVPPDWSKARLLLTVMANSANDLAAYRFLRLHLGAAPAAEIKSQAALNMTTVWRASGLSLSAKPASMDGFNIGYESRARVHDAAAALSSRGEWTLNDLVVYLGSGEDRAVEEGTGVHVGTMHAAKGREWRRVFLVGWEEGTLPSGRKGTDVEEERRLAFIGLTRAAERVDVSWCRWRPQNRGPNVRPGPPEERRPSRFIAEAGLTGVS